MPNCVIYPLITVLAFLIIRWLYRIEPTDWEG